MKLQYLGTAAAEGFPGIFCTCATCARARKAGGRNIRTRSQALVDDCLLIDFPADTYYHAMIYGLPAEKIHHCLITHSHSDHFYPADLEMRRVGFAAVDAGEPFRIYAAEAAYQQTEQTIREFDLNEENRVEAHLVIPYQPFAVEGYTVTALPADHSPETSPVVYIIEKDGVAMLYAHDTGLFADEVWQWLCRSGILFSFISLDCTAGLLNGWEHGHLGLDTCAVFADKLRSLGCADDRTKWCVNHFSHNCLADYDEMVPRAAEYGFDVSYDGKVITF